MQRYFYSDQVSRFLVAGDDSILGQLAKNNSFALEATQRDAWVQEISVLKNSLALTSQQGHIYFEYSIPRLGRRADVILLLDHLVFVLEFKVGESGYPMQALDQVWDYAIDLKNFHESSHSCSIVPILISTKAPGRNFDISFSSHDDRVLNPIGTNPASLPTVLIAVLSSLHGDIIDAQKWETGRYSPTPTIIEAATALYNGHAVSEISRSDAGATNLTDTSRCVEQIIGWARENSRKAICFVTGVPGAGKTLVGLNVATQHTDSKNDLHSVFLSGNGPLVAILREALARDQVRRERERGNRKRKMDALSEVKAFVQNVHHFRDECLVDSGRPPIEHVAIFDEAQRAWNLEQTAAFMARKKGRPGFSQSEPEFLISCLDRHADWAVIVCLVGGGQEINTGEAGIGEWIHAIMRLFPDWSLFISSQLTDSEYTAENAITAAFNHGHCHVRDELHLAVSMRSFRAENVSHFVKCLLDLNVDAACEAYRLLSDRYPLVLTRSLVNAKSWLKQHARGSERYGLIVSSEAQRLKPHAIDVRVAVDPIHWFLGSKDDVRSSYYLEDVATEFQVQGLELDWTCVTWDADFRRTSSGWDHYSFVGDRWNRIKKRERQDYLKNAYRVLLTRARQGMVIVVPEGDPCDPTRSADFYDQTFEYLTRIGIRKI